MERAAGDDILSVMHWLKYEGFCDSVSESIVRKFMVVPDLPAVLGALTKEGLLAQESDRLHLNESGVPQSGGALP